MPSEEPTLNFHEYDTAIKYVQTISLTWCSLRIFISRVQVSVFNFTFSITIAFSGSEIDLCGECMFCFPILGKAGRKFSSKGKKAPGYWLSPSYFQIIKRMPAPDWAQKMLCVIVPNRRTVSPEFFSWVRTRRLLFRSRIVWLMHQEMHAVRKLSVWYKIPIWFQNTVCPKTKDTFPKIQAWAYNRYSRLHRSHLA